MVSLALFRSHWKHLVPQGWRVPSQPRMDEVRDIWRLRDGSTVLLRVAGAEDGPLLQELVRGLSLKSRYQRFFYPLHELTPAMLDRFTQREPTGAMTLLALARKNGRRVPVAIPNHG